MELLLHNKSSRSSRQQLLLVILLIQSGGNPLWRRMFYAINLILGGGTGHVTHSLYISWSSLLLDHFHERFSLNKFHSQFQDHHVFFCYSSLGGLFLYPPPLHTIHRNLFTLYLFLRRSVVLPHNPYSCPGQFHYPCSSSVSVFPFLFSSSSSVGGGSSWSAGVIQSLQLLLLLRGSSTSSSPLMCFIGLCL